MPLTIVQTSTTKAAVPTKIKMSGPTQKSTSGASFGTHIPSIDEKNKQIQQETMMEKLRAKYRNKPKTYDEIKKSVRMYFIEKHYSLDPLCKATLQSALDKLQHYIKITSRHGLVERLESLSRQLGLKFMEDQQLLFISTDMFYVEILLDTSGNLSDVKVHHECKIEQQSSDLVKCLKSGDFADFTVQLEGLSSIYQLNAEPKVKKKAFVALQAMESDINNIYQMQSRNGDSYEIMSNSSVGLVLQRRGGHPMKLTYFCPPIHLPEGETRPTLDFSIEQVMRSTSALSATVNLEGSSANKLQIMPTVSFCRDAQTGLEVPTYGLLNQNNSMLMPATYVLRLSKPMPVCLQTLRALGLPLTGEVISGCAGESTSGTTVMNLIVQTASKQAIKSIQKGLYVNLPKETHCYFFTDNRKLQGTLISSLPFTEAAQVPKIITFLKKQALFYTLLSSCVREQQKPYNDMDSTIILEVTAVSFNQITVELQHPYEESLATVDFLLEDSQVTCSIYCLNNNYEALSQKLTRTARKVFSIPMVVYKLLKNWDEQHQQKLHGVIGTGAGGSGGFGSSNNNVQLSNSGGNTTSSFNQIGIETGIGETGGCFTNVNNLKIDAQVRSLADAFAASTSAAAAIAGLINLKRETDPQATTSMAGATTSMPKMEQVQSKASDIEIADKYKNIWKDKTANLKHCVSITPIPSDGKVSQSQQQLSTSSIDVTRTGGIEIIPLNAQASTSNATTPNAAATTITITPITGKESSKEKKSNSSGGNVPGSGCSGTANKRPHDGSSSSGSGSSNNNASSTETQKEKKRKKKRDDSPMGPPEKVYSRQNSPAAGGDPTQPSGGVRKGGAASTGLMTGMPPCAALSTRPSPKHSPVYSSPKHNTASNSPKSPFGTHSPKHGSSGGKPSMSTLKSATAATSLSPKGEKSVGVSSSVSNCNAATPSANNPALVRSFAGVNASVPALLSNVPTGNLKREKEKSVSTSSSPHCGSNVSNVSTNVAAVSGAPATASVLKNVQQQQQQPQLQHPHKSPVASLSHLAAGGNMNAYAASGHVVATAVGTSAASAMELNVLRKGMAGGAVSLMTSTAALAALTATTTQAAATATMPQAVTSAATPAVAATLAMPTLQAAAAVATTTTITTETSLQQVEALHSSASAKGVLATSGSSENDKDAGINTAQASTEYMVKPSSQEGLKLTINKTNNSGNSKTGGNADNTASSSNKSKSCTGFELNVGCSTPSGPKKQHTGLKPGVNSGPASKKGTGINSAAMATSSSKTSSTSGSSLSSTKHIFQKANSSGNLSGKLSTAGGGVPLTKSNSTNSFSAEHSAPLRRPSMGGMGSGNSSGSQRKSSASGAISPAALSGSMSQPPPRFDHHTDMMTILQYASPSMAASMEGFIKGLHNKFQIPKLSQRGNNSASSGRNTPSTEPGSSSFQEHNRGSDQASAQLSAPLSSATDIQKPSTAPDLALNLANNSMATDGIDEELLASLAGE